MDSVKAESKGHCVFTMDISPLHFCLFIKCVMQTELHQIMLIFQELAESSLSL